MQPENKEQTHRGGKQRESTQKQALYFNTYIIKLLFIPFKYVYLE